MQLGMRLGVSLGYIHYAVRYEVKCAVGLHTFMQLGMR